MVRKGHPWIYSDSIRSQNREGRAGELAIVYDRKDRFLAAGFYDPDSPLRIRVVHCGKPVTIDQDFWRQSLDRAIALRQSVARADTNGFRLIHGESDGWPGLVLDHYDGTLVLKLYSVAWIERLSMLTDLFLTRLAPDRIVLRLSRNLQDRSPLRDGSILHGPPLEGDVLFLESGIRFAAEVARGQKTGFFLDQRENRRQLEGFAHGADVLNAFSFTGGFSLYAARGGARSVTDLDISEHALAAGRRNFELNRDHPRIASCHHTSIQADVFEWLSEAAPSSFDIAVIDPPSLAKRETERARAIQAYRRLNFDAIRTIRLGGLLLAASCSAHVSSDEFFGAVHAAAIRSGRRYREILSTQHAPDHPATFPEAHYLKCLYLRFEG